MKKVERNDPCPCGSGKKYKQCCLKRDEAFAASNRANTVSTSKSLQEAIAHHQAGHLSQAEAIYRQILQVEPDHLDALHLLGLVAYQAGKNEIAVELIGKALSIKPDFADAHNNLGMALKDLGRLDEAAEHCHQALALMPDYTEAHNNLGLVLKEQGKLDEAVGHYRKALALKPDFSEALSNLGNALQAKGKLDEAVECYRKAIFIKPVIAEMHNNLGDALLAQDKQDEAVECYRMALALKPDFAEAHTNLGNLFQAQGLLDEAVEHYRKAIFIKPDYVVAISNLGDALQAQGKLDEAVDHYRKALALKPDFAEAHSNFGLALQKQGSWDEAIEYFLKALAIKHDFAEAHNHLGNALQASGLLDGAAENYRRALEIKPGLAEAHNNLGNTMRDLGRLEEAVASYSHALKIKPNFSDAYGNMLYLHAFTRNISPESECGLAANWENIVLNESERIAARNRVLLCDDSLTHSPQSGRKLKIGVVSAEIGQHAVAEFMEPFLEQLDRSRFHVTLFPTATEQGARADRFRELADEFKPLVGIPDNKAAELIRSDRIDILIDTTAYMSGCRLGIFAHRAAPVQCHYIGYHGSTGLTEMDWFIADENLLPPACDAHFREGIWRLPRLWIAYRGDVSLPGSRWTPVLDGTVWLGSFNNLAKVREETLALWAKVMNAIPEARLLLKDRKAVGQSVQGRIRMELARHGISGERVEFSGYVSDWCSHMALYDRLDIALDTIPLNSGTTAFDALWMGVPLVALEGNWMGGRLSSAILKALGKPEWVAQNEDEYVAIVAALARNVEGRQSLRATQRALMAGSPLCDAKGLTRALENAFEKMFELWMEKCGGGRKDHHEKQTYNDSCFCGSGKEYKQCCQKHDEALATSKRVETTSSYKAVQEAIVHHSAGRLPEAAACYQQILQTEPNHPDALHLLGLLAHQLGRSEIAVDLIGKALSVKPDFAEAHNNLGNLLKEQGRLNEANEHYCNALEIKPDYAEAHSNLGDALRVLRQFDAAVASCRRALSIKLDFPEAHNNLGNAFYGLGQLNDAVTSYRLALEIKPDYVEAHYNLGNALRDIGKLDDAVASYRMALEIKPDYAGAHFNMGSALSTLGQLDDAVASYRVALEIKPDYAEVHSNLGVVLQDLGRLDDAVASLRRALEIKPDFAEAHSNLGNALKDLGQLDSAVASCRRALEIKPDFAEAHSNLGNALKDIGQLDDAMVSYRRALEIKPDYSEAHSNLLFALNYHPDLSAEDVFSAYQEYDANFGYPLRPAWRAHGNDRNPNRRLRVGYVSPDFRSHSTRSFLEPLLAYHDKSQVEMYAYAELVKEDEMSARYQGYVEHWIPTKGMSDEALAERIRSDGIDILVELAGHSANNRLLTFARKPAPVSLSWLGYGYTTGLGAIDYYLTDEACAPPGSEGLFSEQPWRIATPAYVYHPTAGMGEVNSLPAQQMGCITFGTLTRSVRINHRTIRVWSEILKRVEGSRLVIDSSSFRAPSMQEQLSARFAEHGISRDRLEIGCHSPPWDVLRGIDIGLDCFPHNSGTTLFESLYMGVPFITLAGRPSVGRLGSSILRGIGHPEWIAENEDEYVAKAVELASDVNHLSEIRSTLRGQMEASPLRNEAGFARKVEDAYRGMWKIWCEKGDKA